MSRAGLAGIALLGGALGLVVFLLTRGLPDEAKADAAAANEALEQAEREVAQERTDFDTVVAEDPDFLKPIPEVAQSRTQLRDLSDRVAALRGRFDNEIKPLLDADRHADAERLEVLAGEISAAARATAADRFAPAITARRFLAYKKNHRELVAAARQALAEVEVLGRDSALPALVQGAAGQYPEAAKTLDQRLGSLTTALGGLTRAQAELDAAVATNPPDYLAAGRLSDQIVQGHQALTAARSKLMSDVAGLGKSIDRILIDMKEEDGLCYHRYRTLENGLAQESGFEVVDCAFYREHVDHLGMALYSKPEGQLDEEAVKVASPPGYTYVGNPRYGQWQESNGTRFWVFYGQYALMRDLLWGTGGYRPVYDRDYQSYRSNLSSRRPWYGGSNEFGTRGTATKIKYGNSTYYRREAEKARYSGSRFQETNQGRGAGTGYRGSRFQGGGGSAPLRSGGNRSAPVRRSSFGGGGK